MQQHRQDRIQERVERIVLRGFFGFLHLGNALFVLLDHAFGESLVERPRSFNIWLFERLARHGDVELLAFRESEKSLVSSTVVAHKKRAEVSNVLRLPFLLRSLAHHNLLNVRQVKAPERGRGKGTALRQGRHASAIVALLFVTGITRRHRYLCTRGRRYPRARSNYHRRIDEVTHYRRHHGCWLLSVTPRDHSNGRATCFERRWNQAHPLHSFRNCALTRRTH